MESQNIFVLELPTPPPPAKKCKLRIKTLGISKFTMENKPLEQL